LLQARIYLGEDLSPALITCEGERLLKIGITQYILLPMLYLITVQYNHIVETSWKTHLYEFQLVTLLPGLHFLIANLEMQFESLVMPSF
jgi:hypothetical protein